MESSEPAPELSLLQRIRNTWEFSNLMQFIFIFGKAVKIDEDFSIDVGPSILSGLCYSAQLKSISCNLGSLH